MLLLIDGILCGGEFHRQYEPRNFKPAQTNHSFELSNGIYLGMPLNKAKDILGDQLLSQWKMSGAHIQKIKYIDGLSLVTISCAYNRIERVIDSYDIESIQISPISNAFN